MAKNKTIETESSVDAYLDQIADEKKRKDCVAITELFKQETGLGPKMWGPGIVGFGSYHYKYQSGREGDAPLAAFAARANAITLYLDFDRQEKEALLQQLGKHKTSKGCIYIKKLEDIDAGVLRTMISRSVAYVKQLYPG